MSIKMEETKIESQDLSEKVIAKKPYSWGPLYETLQEMIQNGDELPDEGLKKGFELFHKLDNAKTIEEICNIISQANLTKTEQLRLNSPCLDSITDSCYKFNFVVYGTLNTCLDAYIFYIENISMRCFPRLLCITGQYDKLKYLIDKNYMPENTVNLSEYIDEASRYMHYDIVNLLIDYINKIRPLNLSNIYGNALAWILDRFVFHDPVYYRAIYHCYHTDYNDWTPIVHKLVDSGANLNINSLEPLRNACEKNSVSIVKLLLEKGAVKIPTNPKYSLEVQELLK